MSVLVVGSAALDTIETPSESAREVLGGSAIYFSTAASFFTRVHLVAVVGNDFPMQEIEYLKAKAVDLSGLTVEEGKTFRWGGRYELDLNNRLTLFTELNVFERFNPLIPESMREIPYVFLANIQPALQMRVLEQMKRPRLVVMDTMNFWIERTPEDLRKLLERVDILIVNDSEVRQLTGELNLLKAGRAILHMGIRTLVIKKGEHGAMMVNDGGCFWTPAYPLETIVDPTGAGDSFAGGFVGYLAKTDDPSPANLQRAVVYGSIMGSFCVEDLGPERLKHLTTDQIETRYREFVALTHFV